MSNWKDLPSRVSSLERTVGDEYELKELIDNLDNKVKALEKTVKRLETTIKDLTSN